MRRSVSARIAVAAVLVGLLAWGTAQPANAVTDRAPDEAAESLVRSYLDAVQIGDTEGMLELLGDPLLARLARILANPTYGSFLREQYRGSSFEIGAVEAVSGQGTVVNVEIALGDGSTVTTRFLVAPAADGAGLRICDEFEGS